MLPGPSADESPQPPVSKDQLKYWIALNQVLGVGKTLFHRLVRHFHSPEGVFSASPKSLMAVDDIGPKTAQEICHFDIEKSTERELQLLDKLGARVLTCHCADYPHLLQSIYDPPPLLYIMGNDVNQYPVPLALVGTRNPTSYGKAVAKRLAQRLAEMGVCLVSGMARGIDTLAHNEALRAGEPTIAVFGNGLMHTYPYENDRLRQKITQNGAILSEFGLSVKPERGNFPARNRIISGLSYGSILIEAGEKSGALITARFALEQGRDVFAVPGNINSPQSRGTNRLIKMGAKLVDGPEAVVEELAPHLRDLLKKKKPEEKNKTPSDLTPAELGLVSLMGEQDRHIDYLIENSNLSPAEVSATLVRLELKGHVLQKDGKMFCTNSLE